MIGGELCRPSLGWQGRRGQKSEKRRHRGTHAGRECEGPARQNENEDRMGERRICSSVNKLIWARTLANGGSQNRFYMYERDGE